ncbi:MAG TPA: PAC2 family protein [Pirellulales bacterium]
MAVEKKQRDRWLVAVWPGMGHVALAGGYYLMSKLGMSALAEFSARELFDVEQVEVKNGLIQAGRLPRSRLFLWNAPGQPHDIIVFIGEAQPPLGKYTFCRRLIEYAQKLGVTRVFTFAAMATQMHPEHDARVFAAATDEQTLDELRPLELTLLNDGQISGLNGVLLGAAAEAGLHGACLLGEMPHIFAQVPFPKASLAVLRVFAALAGIEIDLTELEEQAAVIERQLGQLLSQIEEQMGREYGAEEEPFTPEVTEEPRLAEKDARHIERLFEQAAHDRAKAYELKRELDRLEVFADYEDRFLDLFRKAE